MRNQLYKSILHTGKKVNGFAAEEIYLKQATANESKNKAIFSMGIAGVRAFSFFGLSQKELYFFGYSFIIYCVAYDPF